MGQSDVDLEGITFRSPREQDLFMAGQRERAIAELTKHPVAKKEVVGKARELLYQAAKSREHARRQLEKVAKPRR